MLFGFGRLHDCECTNTLAQKDRFARNPNVDRFGQNLWQPRPNLSEPDPGRPNFGQVRGRRVKARPGATGPHAAARWDRFGQVHTSGRLAGNFGQVPIARATTTAGGYDYAMCTAVAYMYRPNCGWSTERCCHTLLVFENEIDDTGLGE